jgi:hypothetical protein
MKTDMDFNNKNGIKSENKTQIENKFSKEKEFISSSGIYSDFNKNSNLSRSIQPSIYTNPNPQNVNNNPLHNSMGVNNYQNNNKSFYNTQINFRRNQTTQLPQEFFPQPHPAITTINPQVFQTIPTIPTIPLIYQQYPLYQTMPQTNPQTQDVEFNANLPEMLERLIGGFSKLKSIAKII